MFTLSTRKILLRLRAMRVPSTTDMIQSKAIFMIVARRSGNGVGAIIDEVNLLPH